MREILTPGTLGVLVASAWALPFPLEAQIGVVIWGRVEDSVSREPLQGALIISADSTAAVLTDSLGTFAIPMGSVPPFVVVAEQFGYEPQIFELSDVAPSQLSILVLDPAPIPVDGVTVVGESEITVLVDRLESRRNSYPGAVTVYDRDRIADVGVPSALELVLRRAPDVRDCSFLIRGFQPELKLCRRPRRGDAATSFQGGPPTARAPAGFYDLDMEILVCIDGVRAYSHFTELESIPIEQVALFESYGRRGTSVIPFTPAVGQVRIYTRQYITSRAGRPTALMPPLFGC